MRPLLFGRHGSRGGAYVPSASGEGKVCGYGGNVNEPERGGIYKESYQRVSASGVSGCGSGVLLRMGRRQHFGHGGHLIKGGRPGALPVKT